jgi:hypothetical protein
MTRKFFMGDDLTLEEFQRVRCKILERASYEIDLVPGYFVYEALLCGSEYRTIYFSPRSDLLAGECDAVVFDVTEDGTVRLLGLIPSLETARLENKIELWKRRAELATGNDDLACRAHERVTELEEKLASLRESPGSDKPVDSGS